MDFNLKKLAGNVNINKLSSDVTSTFSRVKQFTEEKLGKSERTELDGDLGRLLARADRGEEHTKRVLNAVVAYLQPDPTARYEELVYDKLEAASGGAVPIKDNVAAYTGQRQNKLELLGQAMLDAGHDFGKAAAYGGTLVTASEAEFKVAAAERRLCDTAAQKTLGPLRDFLDGQMKTIARERKELHKKRLDLDACKGRLKKAKTADPPAEADLRVAQSDFERQAELLRAHLLDLDKAYMAHESCMRSLVAAQAEYYGQCHQHMAELQRRLASVDLSRAAAAPNATGHTSVALPGDPHAAAARNGSAAIAPDDFSTRQATAAFDYEPAGVGEIGLVRGEVVIVYRLPGVDADYVMAEKGGRRGKVPISFIDVAP